jgi:hypothetical protein
MAGQVATPLRIPPLTKALLHLAANYRSSVPLRAPTMSDRTFLVLSMHTMRVVYAVSCSCAVHAVQVTDKDLAETVWLIAAKHAPPTPPQLGPRQLAIAQAHLEDVAAVAVAAADAELRAMAAVALRILPDLEVSGGVVGRWAVGEVARGCGDCKVGLWGWAGGREGGWMKASHPSFPHASCCEATLQRVRKVLSGVAFSLCCTKSGLV